MAFFEKHSILMGAGSEFSRTAVVLTLFLGVAGCQSAFFAKDEEWAAHGFMGPVAVGNSELIGVYDKREDCARAAEDWMSRQVAGNPVFADCYPVDKH